LSAFAEGFHDLARRYEIDLIGGDTTRGPLAFTVTALGEVVAGKALRRDQAKVGDEVWVSGQIGSAALALRHIRGDLRLKAQGLDACMARLEKPLARVELGQQLIDVANSAIDVSDGLVADARHICERSGVGIDIDYAQIPTVAEVAHLKGDRLVREALLAGGDDYELLFTAPAGASVQLDAISGRLGLALTRIGRVVSGAQVRVLDESGAIIDIGAGGYEHFV
jgi:thiamine-monophosphate kinase